MSAENEPDLETVLRGIDAVRASEQRFTTNAAAAALTRIGTAPGAIGNSP